ncbi:MAG: MarR family transcriptional regulator [Anaerolineaceae bacterium]|nr:MarR family transcriptional regulator [Anaerolineaceae bacterium]
MPTHYTGDPQNTLALDTFIKFTRASNMLESRLFGSAALEGLTPSQFGVLETLYHLGPLCQGALSAKQLKSTGNITLVLDNLEKRGLVVRERETFDRRMVTICLTPAGEQLIQLVFPRMVEAISHEFGVLSPEEQATLGSLSKILGTHSRG